MPSVTEQKLTNGVELHEEEADILERIDAARIDGRARNVLYRMKQLRAMHSFMLKKRQDFVQALKKGIHTPSLMAKLRYSPERTRMRIRGRLLTGCCEATLQKSRLSRSYQKREGYRTCHKGHQLA